MYGTAPEQPVALLIHAAVLVAIIAVGMLAAFRTFERRLVGG